MQIYFLVLLNSLILTAILCVCSVYFYVEGKILKWFKFDFAICALTICTRCLDESTKLPGTGICSVMRSFSLFLSDRD